MTNPVAFLDGDPDELAEALLTVARRERAPQAARERALASVATASVGAAVATSAKAALSAPALTGGGGMLAAKWLAIGLGGALVGLTAVDQARRAFTPADEPAAAPPVAAAPARSASAASRPPVNAPATPVAAAPAPTSLEPAARTSNNAPSAPVPPDTSARAPSVADFVAPDISPLAREVAALRHARAALASTQPSRALEILSAYRREFPLGALGTEEAALRVEIAFAQGDARAPELARRFLAEHASSPLAARVQSLLDTKRPTGGKP